MNHHKQVNILYQLIENLYHRMHILENAKSIDYQHMKHNTMSKRYLHSQDNLINSDHSHSNQGNIHILILQELCFKFHHKLSIHSYYLQNKLNMLNDNQCKNQKILHKIFYLDICKIYGIINILNCSFMGNIPTYRHIIHQLALQNQQESILYNNLYLNIMYIKQGNHDINLNPHIDFFYRHNLIQLKYKQLNNLNNQQEKYKKYKMKGKYKYIDLCIINKMANINEQRCNNQEMHNMMQQVHYQYQNIPNTYLTNYYYGQFFNKLYRFLFHHHLGLRPYQYQQHQDLIRQCKQMIHFKESLDQIRFRTLQQYYDEDLVFSALSKIQPKPKHKDHQKLYKFSNMNKGCQHPLRNLHQIMKMLKIICIINIF
ncbi:unnamed protein product [Paramecium pentaurelia]|uniref:Uncharacterized protein n=1 Tax=Paramecium pentaurelia TaxID=43138 RepID=A0A8S1US93_9CILI|nr:unnamed protein product [Paramecium pentaurelia]